jgi:putative phosphoribosyl transferase
MVLFDDRRSAGQQLAHLLEPLADRDNLLVLALPRGGVPVGYEVSRRLHAPMDVFVVRKLGVPGHEELAMGAVASGGILLLDEGVVQSLRVPREVVEQIISRERQELMRREEAYRDSRPAPSPRGRCVILVDDGIATGSSMEAAVLALRQQDPQLLIVAVPVAPSSTVQRLSALVDEVITIDEPETFGSVGQFYREFTQVNDQQVRQLLE